MTTINTLENKISLIEKYQGILEKYQNKDINKIKENDEKRGAVERYLYLICQSTIDLAEAFISFKKLRKPTSMSESFHILKEKAIINLELTEKLIKMTGFRNIIAYDYDQIDYQIVEVVLNEGLGDIKKFVKKIKKEF